MNANTETMTSDLDDLLAGDWEDLPDDSFAAWPDGTYHCTVTASIKEVAEKPCVEFNFTMMECKELAHPENDREPMAGSKNSELCQLTNEFGLARLKFFLKVFGTHFGISNRREILDVIQDVEVLVVVKRRFDKKNDVWRFRVEELAVI